MVPFREGLHGGIPFQGIGCQCSIPCESLFRVIIHSQVELEETARTAASTPRSSTLPSPITPPEDTGSSALTTSLTEEDSPLPSPCPSSRNSPKRSLMDIIYSENRVSSFACLQFFPVMESTILILAISDEGQISSRFSCLNQLLLSLWHISELVQGRGMSLMMVCGLSCFRQCIINPVRLLNISTTLSGMKREWQEVEGEVGGEQERD